MKWMRAVVVALTVAALSVAAASTASAEKPPKPRFSLHSDNQAHQVVVKGKQGAGGARPSERQGHSAGMVDCNKAARAQLVALGDRNAAQDAGFCTVGGPCGAAADGGALVGRLIVTRHPGLFEADQLTCIPFGALVTPAEVAAQARRLIPVARIGFAPHDTTLVNIDTIMWVGAPREQVLPVIHMLGHDVVVHLSFAHAAWDFGDGATTGSDSPGKAYDSTHAPCRTKHCPGYFVHEYRHTGGRTITATASWTATFSVDGAGNQPIPGAIPGPTATGALVVKQARGVLVPDPGEH